MAAKGLRRPTSAKLSRARGSTSGTVGPLPTGASVSPVSSLPRVNGRVIQLVCAIVAGGCFAALAVTTDDSTLRSIAAAATSLFVVQSAVVAVLVRRGE